ncbi:MAG: HD-GYP domain-containing protein [Lentihominibacter sp.]
MPHTVNLVLHFGMYFSYEVFVALLFWYWISVTVGIPDKIWVKAAGFLPSVILAGITLYFMPQVEFVRGKTVAYSMGTSVYVCFGTVAAFCLLTVVIIIAKRRMIPRKKLQSLATTVVFIIILASIQIAFPEALISCMALIMIILSIYLTMENPAIHGLEHYHNEMVMGFATLVENRDDNTGGHIRRSSAYVEIIAGKLQKTAKYKNIITKDYLNNLIQAAPMHDIGKIGISDVILCKPGKLTDEEFETMKSHAEIGGKIITDAFGHLYNMEYEDMAFQVARHHHEKWNGMGYPDGLAGEEIPLCARIMAVADVFDAISSSRCYREAMPLDRCYEIILEGRGTDFDPDIVDAFLAAKGMIESVYYSINEEG